MNDINKCYCTLLRLVRDVLMGVLAGDGCDPDRARFHTRHSISLCWCGLYDHSDPSPRLFIQVAKYQGKTAAATDQ